MTAVAKYRPSLPVVSAAGGIPVMWSVSPMGDSPVRGMVAPAGTSIAAIVARALLVDPGLPADFVDSGAVTINGIEVPHELWARARPVRKRGRRVVVVLHPGLHGGGGGGGQKSGLGALVQIVAIVASFIVLQPEIGLGIYARAVALGLPLAGPLAVNLLCSGQNA